jgi:aminoglycoside phosphotransferase (APT) family kinase protein
MSTRSNPTYLLEAGATRLVLRKKPPGRLLASAHAVEREYRVLAALAAAGNVPVPRPLVLCEDASVVGTPFYVMEFAEGTIFTEPGMPKASPAQRTAAYAGLADTLAALHAVDPVAVGLAGFGDPSRYCERQVQRWARQYAASVAAPCPRVARLVEWLRANVPAEDSVVTRPSIVHGDYRLDNLVFDGAMRVRALPQGHSCLKLGMCTARGATVWGGQRESCLCRSHVQGGAWHSPSSAAWPSMQICPSTRMGQPSPSPPLTCPPCHSLSAP